MSSPLHELDKAGVSIWLDDLSRDRILSGSLAKLIDSRAVSGVTTNPTIFAGALSKGDAYAKQLSELAAKGASATEAVFEATTQDVAMACDVFAEVYKRTNGVDGRVSIEVEPGIAMDSAATTLQAKQIYKAVDRENVMIKIPATVPGLSAITEVLAEGISVNVTLIFSLDRYALVIKAFKDGIKKAQQKGLDLSTIHSVASFFVSRVDTEINKRLDAIGTSQALELKSKAALANARLAYELFEKEFATDEWKELENAGANKQRPLMASTGVKDPTLPDTLYVTELVAPQLVNTMPEATMEALFDHGVISPDTITGNYELSRKVLADLAELGISYDEIVALLEAEGVEKFVASWNELLETVSQALQGK
ncbi:MAG: transaldolase [Actinomycetota bacterium]|jgi:transaldolase